MKSGSASNDAINRYKNFYAKARIAHELLQQELLNLPIGARGRFSFSVDARPALKELVDWMSCYFQLGTRIQQKLDQDAKDLVGLSEADRAFRLSTMGAENEAKLDAIKPIWNATYSRLQCTVAKSSLLDCQCELLAYCHERHLALTASSCSSQQREIEAAFGSLYPVVGTQYKLGQREGLYTLSGVKPSPMNVILLANGMKSKWNDAQKLWALEIFVGWALSAGTWPVKGGFDIESWAADIWTVFIRDDFNWPVLKSSDPDYLQETLPRLEEVFYTWQRGIALDASRLYRKSEQEIDVPLPINKEQQRLDAARQKSLVERSIAQQSPTVLLKAFAEKEELEKALRDSLATHQFTEREQTIIALKFVDPQIKVRQIAQILGVTERVVTSDLRIIRYHLGRSTRVPTRRRRKLDKSS